jgi:hypothetical protein
MTSTAFAAKAKDALNSERSADVVYVPLSDGVTFCFRTSSAPS